MLKNFFINALRNMKKQRGYVIMNVSGLAIGLTSFLFITLYVIHELSYDRFHQNYENIYRLKVVGTMAGGEIDQAVTAAPMAQAMKNDYPEVEAVTRVRGMGDWLVKYGENRFNEDGILFADSTFFAVYDFRLLKGDPETALARPRSVILTREYAEKYFGDQDPMDKQLSFESDTVIYTVTGVIQDIPDNSHIKFDMLASMSSYPRQANDQFWISHSFYTYIVVRDGTDKDLLEERFQGMVTKYVGPQITAALGISIEDFLNAGNSFRYVMEPLKDLHLRGAKQYNLEPLGSESTVYIFAVIALLVLVIAIINYINLATARSATRAREVGVRKVAGANKRGLVFQFLGESVLIVTTAAIIAVILVYALTPSFNQLIGKELSVSILDNAGGILSLLLLIILVGISSGAYPAFILASFNPIEVLKGTLNPGSMSKNMRGVLVVVQFTISIVIIIGSIIVYRQLNYVTTKDIGFEKENLIVIRRADAFFRQREAFRDQLLQMPGVVNAGFTRAVPGTTFNNNAFLLDDDPEKNTYLINQTQASFDFAQTLGVELAEGRFFSREYGEDSTAILINEAAVKSLGMKDPVGKYLLQPQGPQQFQRLKIIGVMKDFNIKSMHVPIEPVCFTVLGNFGGDQYVAVRLTGEDVSGTVRAIEQKWQSFTPEQPFQYDFFTDSWNNLYSSEMKTGKIFILFSLLAIFLACLGLLGLITYITNKRTREVGIRKTYGASVQVILRLLSREVVFLILISSLLAYPIAYFGSKFWLEAFASRVTVSPVIYVAATIIALAIGWLSILYQTFKAASYSPADALRLEK
ncbi:MAG: ABC transporter permease [Bacteroidales bacterium]|jgi:putative ABC transport system permease protein|nr:ABC transporter permease [Bacteroidales bacterium]